ncbi:MAG: histidine kinase [Bacteroidota bacterium]
MLISSMWYIILAIRQWRIEKKDWRNLVIGIGFISILISVAYYFYGFGHEQSSSWALFARIGFTGLIVYIIQKVIWTQEKVTTLLLEKEQLQSENFKIQLKELRNQMDPHFFFNSLNTLRSMVRQNHANAEQFIIGLSDFYRQILKNNDNTTLPLSKEVAVLESYLFLMKNRNEKALQIDLEEMNETYSHYKIPTLALQSVVENCFKHNSMTSKMPLHIEVRYIDDGYVEVKNNIQPKLGGVDSTGYGLDLLRKRYELMNVADGVLIEQSPDQFRVKLKLIR